MLSSSSRPKVVSDAGGSAEAAPDGESPPREAYQVEYAGNALLPDSGLVGSRACTSPSRVNS